MNNSASDFFNPDPRISKCQRWKHAGYYVVRFVKCFFSHPLKKESYVSVDIFFNLLGNSRGIPNLAVHKVGQEMA